MLESAQTSERPCDLRDAANRGVAAAPVYVIDDDGDLRKSLHFLLSASGITVWPFSSAEDFFDHLPTLNPGPILLDMRMPGIDGLEALDMLRQMKVRWPVIVMTAHGDIPIAVRAMKLGAVEFLEKPFRADMLDHALLQALDILDKSTDLDAQQSKVRALLQKLSRREGEVVAILVEGLSNKAAAHRLGLSTRTIEMHRRNALKRLGVKSIAETVTLVARAEVAALGT